MGTESTSARKMDLLTLEEKRCLDSFDYIVAQKGADGALDLFRKMGQTLKETAASKQDLLTTPYTNTIETKDQPKYPGDLKLEAEMRNFIRWNAMAMVVKANRENDGLGGHISTFASSVVLYEVGFNHFFRGNGDGHEADQIFIQGHASPGIYARSYLERRLEADKLHAFRQELTKTGGLSSYPHPFLMPDYWQFPTVSMGLGPISAIYQARFNKYMEARGLKKETGRTWCFVGDGEVDEVETLGALSIAARENLHKLTFVVNCNLQRLDGPVRGNSKIIQELEAIFTGAGWNVIKVCWGSDWDELLASDQKDLLIKRMGEAVDGDYQKYTGEPGSYARKHFFGKYPELLELVQTLKDDDLARLRRGGHDPVKVHAAYDAAIKQTNAPTVILAKTVKGYGMGEAGEGKNISHQQKKMNEKELREFRERFNIPIPDEDVVETPFYRPDKNSLVSKYMLKRRKELGGFLPERKVDYPKPELPDASFYEDFKKGSTGRELSTTMSFVRLLTKLLRDKNIGQSIVPIIPDEARTFGMEALFRQIGIYSAVGQLYEPIDKDSLLYYREEKDGQILEEGINEAGSMASFVASATSYATHGVATIPFYIYYSMFGPQRVGDMMWLCSDIRAKGFLLGGTSGRTTLNGEGLQHQDGHSLLLLSTIPCIQTYDIAFGYEVATIVQDGLKRMYVDNEDIFYYLTLCNENYEMPDMPEGVDQGILEGLYPYSKGPKKGIKAHIFGSGTIMREAIKAVDILALYGVSADVWGATNYKRLREGCIAAQRYNMLHPTKKPQVSYLEKTLADAQKEAKGPFIAVSDNMRAVSDQIAPWVPGGLFSLGTDGLGRSDTREHLRDFFEVDARYVAVATLYKLSLEGKVDAKLVQKAIKELDIDPEKIFPPHSVCGSK